MLLVLKLLVFICGLDIIGATRLLFTTKLLFLVVISIDEFVGYEYNFNSCITILFIDPLFIENTQR